MNYQLATFGNNIMIEATSIDAATFQAIKEALPAATQERVIGWRRVASVTADRRAA